MKKIFGYFKPYKWQALLGPFFKLLEATFELIVPFVVAAIVDTGFGAQINGAYPNADKGYIIGMCALLAGFGLVGFIFSVAAQYFSARAATGVCAGVRKDLFKKIQSLSYKDIDKMGEATILTRMTGDVDKMQTGINLFLRLFLRSPFIVFGALVCAMLIDFQAAGVFAIAIVVLAIVVYAVMLICMPLYKKSQAKLDNVLLSTRENLSGARVIRAFCQEDGEREVFDRRNGELNKASKFVGGIAAITNPLTYAFINVGIIALLYVGALRVESGVLSQGEVIALYNLMGQILIELIKLANLIVTVAKATASAGRVESVLKMQSSLQILPDSDCAADERQPFIVFDGVFARYNDGGDEALENISFTAERGETIGIIGGTGSGKTTLINLLPHFYDVSGGQVRIDGRDVREEGIQTYLREKIGVVPQKAQLFKGTIRENLLWGKADATEEALFAAVKIAQAEDVITNKGGLDAEIEQGGKNLSGGQKQRLTIARALVREPEILILDDSSSALDYATDAALRAQIKTLKTTTFIVSQRASSVKDADKIVVLDDGKAVGVGTHEELMQSCDVYKEIYFSQYQDEKEGGAA
jgi:ABC-type multidrug transport system fused ATPase/permease subunit